MLLFLNICFASWDAGYTYNVNCITKSDGTIVKSTDNITSENNYRITTKSVNGDTDKSFSCITKDNITKTLNKYTITYDLDDDTIIDEQKVTTYNIETDTFTLPVPTKTGYTFIGWTGSNGNTPQTSVSITKGSNGDKSYTANWKVNILYGYKETEFSSSSEKFYSQPLSYYWKEDVETDSGSKSDGNDWSKEISNASNISITFYHEKDNHTKGSSCAILKRDDSELKSTCTSGSGTWSTSQTWTGTVNGMSTVTVTNTTWRWISVSWNITKKVWLTPSGWSETIDSREKDSYEKTRTRKPVYSIDGGGTWNDCSDEGCPTS